MINSISPGILLTFPIADLIEWNANTNTPTLGDNGAGGSQEQKAVVTTAGTTSIDGVSDWAIGDVLLNTGDSWIKIDNTDAVVSVVGETGAITASQVATAYEALSDTNKYTDAEKTKLGTVSSNADQTNSTTVNAAGAVMESDTTTAGMSFVVDEDAMTSNSATLVPTQQSVKAYTDNEIASAIAGGMQLVNTISSIDLTSTGTTDLYTVPTGYELPPTEFIIIYKATAYSGASSVTASFGTNSANFDNMGSSFFTNIAAVDECQRDEVSFPSDNGIVSAGEVVKLNVTSASTGTYTVKAWVFARPLST